MASLNGLPVYYIKINEDLENKTGIDFISLVDCPAIESNWVAFSKTILKFSSDADKQILCGPILIPDLPIYRHDDKLGEYYVVFKADEIEKLVRKFQATQKTINLNYQHQKDSQLKSAVVQEIWLTGKNDKSKDFGFNLAEGSAFVCAFIGDKTFWEEEIKTGKVLGFSIEGFLDMELKKVKMNNQKFEVHKQADGMGDVYLDGPVAVDTYVFSNYPSITLVNGVKQVTQYPVWQEIIVLADGSILTLKDSKIIKVEKKYNMSNQKFITAKSDKGELTCDGESFTTGMEIYSMVDGKKTTPADGDYVLENGSTLKISAGKITEITEPEMSAEETEIIQNAVKPLFEKFAKEFKDLKDSYETRIKDLETRLASKPGAPSATSKTDGQEPVKLSARAQLSKRLEILRKKDKEIKN